MSRVRAFDELDRRLLILRAVGMTYAQIADEVSMSKQGVAYRVWKLRRTIQHGEDPESLAQRILLGEVTHVEVPF